MLTNLKRLSNIILRYALGFEAYARRSGVEIGSGCRIYTHHFGSEPFLVRIGNRCTIANGTRFVTHDGSYWLFRQEMPEKAFRYGPVVVEDDVFIGMNCILMPGVRIGRGSIVGAGAVVTKSVPAGSICVGVPARVIAQTETLRERVSRQDQDFPRGFEFWPAHRKEQYLRQNFPAWFAPDDRAR